MLAYQIISLTVILLSFSTNLVSGWVWCYSCYHGQPGCNEDVDWQVQRERAEYCEDTCVKYIDDTGVTQKIYRGCLATMMKKTFFREKMPGLRRHGYCLPARSHDTKRKQYDPLSFVLEDKQMFCFCDEYIWCNSGNRIGSGGGVLFGILCSFLAGVIFYVRQ